MTATEDNLNQYIEALKAQLQEAEQRYEDTKQKLDFLERRFDADDLAWALPRHLESDDLPVPRLELRWKRVDEGGFAYTCTYMLVYHHFLGLKDIAGPGDPKVIGLVMGLTTLRGSARTTYVESSGNKLLGLSTPFREWSHALSDAEQLKLPLFITTDAGDVAQVNIKAKKQTLLRLGGVAV